MKIQQSCNLDNTSELVNYTNLLNTSEFTLICLIQVNLY